ncbi:MAG: arginine N-succinyltransferase [Bdellovibrionaceae bacterium]|nr:arginine N-succinyltransferase [Pseudobdellovibrionaceae bacterium]
MSFIVRNIREDDFEDLLSLAKQFNLLNLPAEPKILKKKIQQSVKSFAGKVTKEEAEYLFVLEDVDVGRVIGTSLILAKHGTPKYPHYFFQILEKKRQSSNLGVGFIHNVLRLGENTDGPTEVGGLMLDRGYRRRPEKLGRLLSLSRFIYMGLLPQRFESEVLCELSPPLTDEGRSEFWEALGRRFTGMSYLEADRLSQMHKGFIKSLFPEGDIYLCLLEASARVVVGEVGDETRGARHLLEKIGFKYRHEVDPFDGGPHYSSKLSDISLIKNGSQLLLSEDNKKLTQELMLGLVTNDGFVCAQTQGHMDKGSARINATAHAYLKDMVGKKVFCSTI